MSSEVASLEVSSWRSFEIISKVALVDNVLSIDTKIIQPSEEASKILPVVHALCINNVGTNYARADSSVSQIVLIVKSSDQAVSCSEPVRSILSYLVNIFFN